MKKITFLLLASLFVLNGCTSQDDPIPQFEPAESPTEATYTRSVADAIAIADAFLDAGNDKVESRAGRTPKVAAILGATSRSESDTLLYSVNYGEDDGFVIVSAKATPQPVLAYVEKGSYDGEPTQNTGFEEFIGAAKSYSNAFDATFDTLGNFIRLPRPYTIYKVAQPAKETQWGQSYPEGLLCPNWTSGCVQTAIAQAFAHIEKPASIALTYPGVDKNSLSLNWAEIKKHKKSESEGLFHQYFCNASNDAHMTLAYLCRELGHRNHATYRPDSVTGAGSTAAYNTLCNILGSTKVNHYTGNRCALDTPTFFDYFYERKGVALMFGIDESAGGHCWYCEGGRSYEYHSGMPQCKDDEFSELKELVTQTYYYYFNWGWCGHYDGYFYGGVYDNTKGLKEEELPEPVNPTLISFADQNHFDFKYGREIIMIYK